MRLAATLRIFGLLLMMFSVSMLPPIGIALWYHDGAWVPFLLGFGITFLTGAVVWGLCHASKTELKTRDGFLVVVLFWTVLSTFASLPLFFHFYPHLSFTDSLFESVSGLTTTGASVLLHVSKMPHAVLYYRQQLHLLGGMGIVILAVAVLPMLGIGGMQLYRAETVGPIKTAKLRPRIAESAKALWSIYVGLVVLCALAFWAAGMHLFDAIGESFSTLSTGGFSMHDNSFAYYHSVTINAIATIFMLLGATNFALHFQLLSRRSLTVYFKDPAFMAYLKLLGVVIAIVLITLIFHREYYHGRALMHVIFTVVSVSTTTGFNTVDFNHWPTFVPYLLMFVALLGGCAGSTSGGIKIMRALLLKEQSKRELKRLVHPKAVLAIKLGGQALDESVVEAIWGFAAMFALIFVLLLLMVLADGVPIRTAFGAVSSALSNTGAGIGGVSNTYKYLPTFTKWVLIAGMLLGRLEIFTVLVIFTPSYWRK